MAADLFRLSVGLPRDCRSGLRISACLGTGTILLACRGGFLVLLCAFIHGLSHGRADRDDCGLGYGVSHELLPLSGIWWLSVQTSLREHPEGICEPVHTLLNFFGELAERPSDPALSQRYVLFELNIDGASQLKY